MNKHVGSDFDDFLEADDILEDCSTAAIKRVITWQIKERMGQAKMTRSDLAKRMNTSRAAVARLLDERDEGMTIDTLSRAARALGSRVDVRSLPRILYLGSSRGSANPSSARCASFGGPGSLKNSSSSLIGS
jgi:predicted XRE-type DNA-binding protein